MTWQPLSCVLLRLKAYKRIYWFLNFFGPMDNVLCIQILSQSFFPASMECSYKMNVIMSGQDWKFLKETLIILIVGDLWQSPSTICRRPWSNQSWDSSTLSRYCNYWGQKSEWPKITTTSRKNPEIYFSPRSGQCTNKNWEKKYDKLQYTDLQHYHVTKITLKDHFLTRETLKGSPMIGWF